MANWTPVAEIPRIVAEVKAAFKTGKTRPIEWRKNQLRQLWCMIDICIKSPSASIFRPAVCPAITKSYYHILLYITCLQEVGE